MNRNKPYHSSFFLQVVRKSKGMVLLFLFFTIYTIQASDYIKEIHLDPINTFDEVPVEIIVKGYLRFEADVIITDTHLVYVNVEELFKNLGIFCTAENEGNILKGFIENENTHYLINFDSKQINKGDKTIKSTNGIVKKLGGIYIETSIMNEAFGLNMLFNFRSLSIKLEADFELPMVKQARLKKIRENVSKLQSKSDVIIDTIIGRNYHLFNGGVLDWSISSNQSEGEKTTNRFSLALGSELLYGEAKVAFNYYDQTKFDNRQLYYNWRWIDNDNNYIKQVQVGKIGAQSIAFLGAPLVGASFNNSPNTVRKATGTYTISEYTEPNWTVELYINDILVDYTAADASGLYEFKVPIVYGYTTLKLKFFGPLGEERIEEQTMNTPYTFMPAKVMEYNVSGGILEDGDGNNFGRGEVNYGVNRFVTIGGGVEYLSSIEDKPLIPFANIAIQPFSKMVIHMEYAHNVSLKGLLNYNFGRSAFLEVDYSKYVDGQQATLNNTNEERKIRLSLPYKLNKISGNAKLSFNQYVYDAFNFNQVDALFSGRYKNYSANASLASNWVNDEKAFMTSTVVFSRRLRNGFIIRPTFQYNITERKMMRLRAEVEKRITKMSFSASYERNVQYGTNNVFFSFKYDLPYARTGFTSSYSNNQYSISESAQGSLAFGAGNGNVKAGHNSAIGKGGILCYPFLDLNQNGTKETHEPMVFIKNVKVSGGKAITSEKDSIVRISDLNAFINYNVVFSNNSLDNISWKFKHNTYQILVDPNQYKKVDIPILVVGEVSGMVYLNKNDAVKGQGRITIQIYDNKGNKVAETLSESDGYYSYLGLKPGTYSIKINEEQLKKLGYLATPSYQKAVIKVLADGDIVDGLDFTINPPKKIIENTTTQKDTIHILPIQELPIKVNLAKEKQPSLNKKTTINERSYTLQIGVFKEEPTSKQLFNLTPVFYEILPNGDFRYIFGKYNSLKVAENAKNALMLKGVKGATIITYQNGEEKNLVDFNAKIIQNAKEKETLNTIDARFGKISEIEESFYSVQIGVFKNKVTPKQLLNLTPIFYEVLPNKTTRYIFGQYKLKKYAKIARKNSVVKGIKDAYVVAYQNGKKIDVYELDKIRKHANIMNGKIGGSIHFNNSTEKKTITVQLWSKKGIQISETATNTKGNFSFSDVKIGEYIVSLDKKQLEKLGYKAIPLTHNAVIKVSNEGDIVEGLDFVLTNSKD